MKNSIFKFAATLSAVLLLGALCQPETSGTNTNSTNTQANENSGPSLLVPAPNSNVNEMIVVNEAEESNENTNDVNEVEEEENTNSAEETNENVNGDEEEEEVNENVNEDEGEEEEEENGGDEEEVSAVVVTYNGSSFSPATITLTAGGTITFVNNSSRSMQISSNNHPSHTKNPELGTGPITAAGGSYSVTLAKVGTWGYHDHLNASALGTVVVQ